MLGNIKSKTNPMLGIKLASLWEQLTNTNTNIHARWVPSHWGIEGNDIADYGTQLVNSGTFKTNNTPHENYTHKQLLTFMNTQKTYQPKQTITTQSNSNNEMSVQPAQPQQLNEQSTTSTALTSNSEENSRNKSTSNTQIRGRNGNTTNHTTSNHPTNSKTSTTYHNSTSDPF